MNLLDRIMSAISGALTAEIQGITQATAQRAMSLDSLYGKLCDWAYEYMPGGMYLAQLYAEDDGTLYALFSQEGYLYRAEVTITDGEVMVGELQEVRQEYEPVSRSSITLRELPNGDVRFFLVAATAVVNRVGEIDSTALFDNMVRRAEELNFYPRLDAYHLGSLHPMFEFGEFDFLARDGVSYIASGVMDGAHPLTQATLRQYKADPNSLGASIEYFPIAGAYEDMEIGGATIRTFLDGVNTRISILFEADAASWFTSMNTGDTNMQQRQLDEATKAKLRKLFGDDESAMNKFLGNVEGISRAVEDLGLVHREAAGEDATEEVTTELSATVELDDETLGLIAAEVVTRLGEQHLATVNGAIERLTSTVQALTTSVQALTSQHRAVEDRLGTLEADEETRRQQWTADLPPRARTIAVTHRPRVEHVVQAQPATFADVAEATLAALPDPMRRR